MFSVKKTYMYLMNILGWGGLVQWFIKINIQKATKIYCIPTIKGIRGLIISTFLGEKPQFLSQFIQRKINQEIILTTLDTLYNYCCVFLNTLLFAF